MMNSHDDEAEALRARVVHLEVELRTARSQLQKLEDTGSEPTQDLIKKGDSKTISLSPELSLDSSIHNLMLLSDSALPLGSFAYSSGLESFLAHNKASGLKETNLALFHKFLRLSIQSMAYTNVPYALAAFRDPLMLEELDNDLDASTPCSVARRASIAQGRALLSVWEKAFAMSAKQRFSSDARGHKASTMLELFSRALKISSISSTSSSIPAVNGHLAPLWGAICLCLSLSIEDSAYLFLLNHAKAVVSAAVRASVMGPYMAQSVLAGQGLQDLIRGCLGKVWNLQTEDAGQVVPMLDLWIGRHELLYSRIFNS